MLRLNAFLLLFLKGQSWRQDEEPAGRAQEEEAGTRADK